MNPNTKVKISVKLEASEDNRYATFDLDELGVTKKEWKKMSEDEKLTAIQKAVNEFPEHPYWMTVSFREY